MITPSSAIAGIDSVKLPFYKEKTVYAKAYDVRTEMNQKTLQMVPPCAAESGVNSSIISAILNHSTSRNLWR